MSPNLLLIRSLATLLPVLLVMTTGTSMHLQTYKDLKIKAEQIKEQIEERYRIAEQIASEIP